MTHSDKHALCGLHPTLLLLNKGIQLERKNLTPLARLSMQFSAICNKAYLRMEGILTKLPHLSSEELETLGKMCKSMAKCKSYFRSLRTGTVDLFQDKDKFPSNAAALVADGTIQVLEVVDEFFILSFESGTENKIKMKVEGIEEVVYLCHSHYGGDRVYAREVSLKIGEKVHSYSWERYDAHQYENSVLETLHEALGIPKQDTGKMIRLLFYPYDVHDEIEPCMKKQH